VVSTLRRHALALGALLVYLALTGVVLAGGSQSTERALMGSISDVRHPILTDLALLVTNLGDAWLLTVVSILTVVALAFRSRRDALFVTASVGGAAIIHYLLKALTARPRPDLSPIYEPGGFSFPSGHSMASFCFFVAVALLVPRQLGRARLAAFAAVGLTVFVVGLTRIYLGVHYPTDVLAGWTIGLAWVALLHTWLRQGEPRSEADTVATD
jgi:undecaprenyl-diphosphatase